MGMNSIAYIYLCLSYLKLCLSSILVVKGKINVSVFIVFRNYKLYKKNKLP